MNRRDLVNFGKLSILALVIFFVGHVLYGSAEDTKTQDLSKQEKTTLPGPQGNTLKDSLVEFGMEFLGTPYVTAGNGEEGFDCSGYVYFVYQHFNIDVPRSSADFEHFGDEIPLEHVRKGDLLLFLSPTRNAIGHIGIVSKADAQNSDFIHASSGREMKVIITNLSNAGYTGRFVKAIRVL